MDAARLLADLTAYAERAGVRVIRQDLPADTPAEFDGLSVTLSRAQPPAPAAFILAHSFGSIVGWSLNRSGVQKIFDELRDAKCYRETWPGRFERALSAFRAFEIESSEYAVAALAEIGQRDAIAPYTVYFRADIEAITLFHRCGRAPVWNAFFEQWRTEATAGARQIEPFRPRPIPPFTPRETEKQQVKQQLQQPLHA